MPGNCLQGSLNAKEERTSLLLSSAKDLELLEAMKGVVSSRKCTSLDEVDLTRLMNDLSHSSTCQQFDGRLELFTNLKNQLGCVAQPCCNF